MNKKLNIGLQFGGILLSILIVNSASVQAMESHSKQPNHQLRTIEQPLSTKMAVTVGGVSLNWIRTLVVCIQ